MNLLITGGASGLGKAIVEATVRDDNKHVYFTYCKSSESAKELAMRYGNCTPVYCEFTSVDSVNALTERIDEFQLDVLINNAITGFTKEHFHKTPGIAFEESFRYNVEPTLKITQECIKVFRRKRFGKIINVLTAAILGKPPVGWSEYVANKMYLLSMSKAWAIENIHFNITSNCVSPSLMLTTLTQDIDSRVVDEMIKKHPLRKLLTVQEVAATITFLVGCTQQINGINVIMNAGEEII